ncbi:MAG: YihY/virulence factor BrkB family protein [Anaerotignaceae bacterium]
MEFLEYKPFVFIKKMVISYFEDGVGNSAAALTYYMIFSLFPLIILGSILLGYANISEEVVTSSLMGVLPTEVIGIIEKYLVYVSENKSSNILLISLLFTVYFPIRTMTKIMDEINRAYKVTTKRKIVKKIILVIVFTLFFLFTILISFFLLLVGRNLMTFISNFINISMEFIDSWVVYRFIVMAAICFIAIMLLYLIAPNCKVTLKEAFPGAVVAVMLWLLFSVGFSFYVENMGNYSILFGSLGAIIVLLIWIYSMTVILLMGAKMNNILKEMKNN